MTLPEFSKQLFQLLPDGDSRPFVCHGSPLDCKVFVVGTNAATPGTPDFRCYWREDAGFDYKRWFTDYKHTRSTTVNNGRRLQEISPTRRNLMIIHDTLTARGVETLETNLYTTPTRKANELNKYQQQTAILDFLLEAIQPKVLLVHGKKAVREMEKEIGKPIVNVTEGIINGVQIKILPAQHLSYQTSAEKAKMLGEELYRLSR